MTEKLTLFDKQKIFLRNQALLVLWLYDNGYGATGGELYRTPEQAKLNEASGKGIANSAHTRRLAIDIHLFLGNQFLTDSKRYEHAGRYWESLHVLNRWGGDFRKPDGNHFSMEHEGVQ